MKIIAIICILTVALCGMSYAKPSPSQQVQNQQDDGATDQGWLRKLREGYKMYKNFKKGTNWSNNVEQQLYDLDHNTAKQQEDAEVQFIRKLLGFRDAQMEQDESDTKNQNDAQEQLIGALTGAYHVGKHFGWWNAQKQDNDETELKGLEANLNDVESMQEDGDNNYEGEIQGISPFLQNLCRFACAKYIKSPVCKLCGKLN